MVNLLNMKLIQMGLKHVVFILEDMNLVVKMDYGQNVGLAVDKVGKKKVVE